MVTKFYNGHDVLYHYSKFGGDRTKRAGCRCENMVFVCLFFFRLSRSEARALFVRGTHFEQILFKICICCFVI